MTSAAAAASSVVRWYRRPAWRRRLSYVQDAALVVLTTVFVWVHLQAVLAGSLKNVPFVVEQLVLVALFLTRRRPQAVTTRPFDWAAAAIGGWLPLAYQIDGAPAAAERVGTAIQMAGVSAAALCILYLGRSFGIVAANRGLKTSGPYRIVRHPIYAAHVITGVGFLLANLSVVNGVLLAAVVAGQLLRIRAEERLLVATADYAEYARRVRWRLFPFVY